MAGKSLNLAKKSFDVKLSKKTKKNSFINYKLKFQFKINLRKRTEKTTFKNP